ncbi:hypothetical protein [Thiomicrospira sp. ALE5]|uniref:hypothetical protein n=1 Tax=Thiomicrospira sp. ALE5 TaxID=748650 RepID=UPI0008EF533B|nr:hypothetical protein [Thiomicrospira sp. ALE5]SFR59316.1 hypothetical protein SAMN03092900_1470 [Thiomicrospira sp. ALE5]
MNEKQSLRLGLLAASQHQVLLAEKGDWLALEAAHNQFVQQLESYKSSYSMQQLQQDSALYEALMSNNQQLIRLTKDQQACLQSDYVKEKKQFAQTRQYVT